MAENLKIDLFLDSGAFSAFTQDVKIDINEYIAFIRRYEKHLSVYANLDVIGDAKGTFLNQKIMEQAGLKPLPCFHYGEPIKYLEYYIKRYDYIALGGIVPVHSSQLYYWLDDLFSKYICDSSGAPKVKVHGFGLSSHKLMVRYPWYSVDSTSWVIASRCYIIYLPKWKNGWRYNIDYWKVSVSYRGTSITEKENFYSMSKSEKTVILKYLDEKGYRIGKSEFRKENQEYLLQKNERWAEKKPKDKTKERLIEIIIEEGVCNAYRLRDELNIIYFKDLESTLPEWPWKFKLNNRGGFGL